MPASKGKKVYKRKERSWRGKLTERFPYAKFLKLVLYNGWFAFFAGLIFLISVTVVISIPKFFRVTPNHMDEVEKRSLLDFVQAGQLRKTARRLANQGDVPEAVNAWVQSVQQNPGKSETVREFVSYLVDNDNTMEHIGSAVNFGQWLLKIDRTNSTDAILMARVYNKYGFPGETLKLLEPIQQTLESDVRVEFVKALFENGKTEEFIAEYYQLPPDLQASTKIRPLFLAYQMAFSSLEEETLTAEKELRTMINENPTNDFLTRLMFSVGAYKSNPTLVGDMLDRLQSVNGARPRHHHIYWQVLARSGQAADAREFAVKYTNPPYTSLGLVSQFETLIELGLDEEADEYALKHIQRFGYIPTPWFTICNSLVDRREWGKLIKVAEQMAADSRMLKYNAYAYYYIGKAYFGQNRFIAAVEEFNKLKASGLASDDAALEIIRDLTAMGYPQIANSILQDMLGMENWTERKEFWVSYFISAWNARDLNAALMASTRLFNLDPTDRIAEFNYTGCLIAQGVRKSEALQRSRDIVEKDPLSAPARINLSMALLLNDELKEARDILDFQLTPDSLHQSLRSSYYLAKFILHYKAGEEAQALSAFPKIAIADIYLEQAKQLDAMHQSLLNKAD